MLNIDYSEKDLEIIKGNKRRYCIGLAQEVKDEIESLYHKYQFDELMVINNTHDITLKLESFKAIKEIIDELALKK